MLEEPDLNRLFSVSRVEVIQHISAEELKSILHQHSKSILELQDGPKLEDFENLRSEFDSLKATVSELRQENQEKHEALVAKQASSQAHMLATLRYTSALLYKAPWTT